CAPGYISGDLTAANVTKTQAKCLCGSKVTLDASSIMKDCTNATLVDAAKQMMGEFNGICQKYGIVPAGPTTNSSSVCDADVTAFMKDVEVCVPGLTTQKTDPSKITTAQFKCLCSDRIAGDVAKVIKDCNATLAADAQGMMNDLKPKCAALTSGTGGSNGTTTGSQGSAACQADLSAFAKDVNLCIPNAIDLKTMTVNLPNGNPTQQQLSCLCSGAVQGDSDRIAKDCKDVPELSAMAQSVVQGLVNNCPQVKGAGFVVLPNLLWTGFGILLGLVAWVGI
ncbi:hypothetical protein HDU76_004139, partial [Blyttiomyces sp. JEL0837]